MTYRKLTLAIGSTVLFVAFAMPQASRAAAVYTPAKWKSNATGMCQSSLPVFDGQIRKRPLAVQNEGNDLAFITCSLPYDDEINNTEQPNYLAVRLVNIKAVDAEASCTLVSGTDETANYVVKSKIVPANSRATIVFLPSDLPQSPQVIAAPNFSCKLVPGLGVNTTYYYYDRYLFDD